MGSPFTLSFYAADSVQAYRLKKQAFALVDSLNAIFSDYDPASELSRLSATAGSGRFVPVSPVLFDLIAKSKHYWKASRGAFDITIGSLSRVWRTARKTGRFPTPAAVAAAKRLTGFEGVLLDTGARRICLRQKGMLLDVGGIAKGFIAQKVLDFLSLNGIASALVDAGGDIACSKAPPDSPGWRIGINLPENATALLDRTLVLENKAVATSGDVFQYTEHKGKKYSHILDPRTGYGVIFQRNVTVIAADGATADWLATACSILPVKKAIRLAHEFGAAVLMATMNKEKVKVFASKEF